MDKNVHPVIFFDGVCGLCNGFVDFLFKFDKRKHFHFSPLQSNYAAKTIPKEILDLEKNKEFKSVILLQEKYFYQSSSAILKILTSLEGPWIIFFLFYLIPAFLRDYAYRWIASHRYEWFGKKSECRIPSAEERSRFIL